MFWPKYKQCTNAIHGVIRIGARAILCESDPSLQFGPGLLHASSQLINKMGAGPENKIKAGESEKLASHKQDGWGKDQKTKLMLKSLKMGLLISG